MSLNMAIIIACVCAEPWEHRVIIAILIKRHMFKAVSLQGLYKPVFKVTISEEHRQSICQYTLKL